MSARSHFSAHPLIFSIVTVCLNNLEGLEVTNASIENQEHSEVEWLVIDGGSTDGTVDWLHGRNALTWTSEPDESLYDAMNKGLDRATGHYVIFMNAGDALADPQVLSRLAEILEGSEVPVDLLYGDSIDVLGEGREFYRPARSHLSMWLGMFTQHQAMVFRRGRNDDLRFDLDYKLSADYAFVAEFLSETHGEPVVHRVRWPICRFALGGLATQRRRAAVREDHIIRREVIGLSRPTAWVLLLIHRLHHMVKTYSPWLFRRLRYRS